MGKVCAGIVLYNPSLDRLKENIKSIYNQVEEVFVVDNASNNLMEIKKILSKYQRCLLIENKKNMGIAKALNQLCSKAYKDEFEWILTLDQDTVSPENLIERLRKYSYGKKIGIICPDVHYEGINSLNKQNSSIKTRHTMEIKACMTSASLTCLKAWKEVKGFRNNYFIDYVDNEFCMKLRISGYKILRVNNVYISHELGELGTIKLFGKEIRFSRHSPWRYYYMIRNNRAFIREYHKYIPVFKEKLKLWYIALIGAVTAKNKKETIRYIVKGYIDGKNMNRRI